jgi:hypothetical protein
MINIFQGAEDLESLEDLHILCNMMTIIRMSSRIEDADSVC